MLCHSCRKSHLCAPESFSIRDQESSGEDTLLWYIDSVAWEKENWIVCSTAADKFGSFLSRFNDHNWLKSTLHFNFVFIF